MKASSSVRDSLHTLRSRRAVLRAAGTGGGTAAVAGLLAACGQTQIVERIIIRDVPVERIVTREVPVERVVIKGIPVPAATAAPVGPPKPGGRLRWGTTREPASPFDPALAVGVPIFFNH